MKKFLDKIPYWLVAILALVFILRVPSFFEPYNYGDEMIYLTLGHGIRQGVTLYKDLHDNKPPLLYITTALAGSLFWFKVILAFWNLATIVIFWKLAQIIFAGKIKAQKVAILIFALLTTLPLLEGNIANAELFMVGPTLLAFFILLGKNLNPKKVFLAGILFGTAALFKVPAVFELPVIPIIWLISLSNKKSVWKKIASRILFLGLGFATPILLTFVWFFFKGAFPEYLKAAFLQNAVYLSSWRPGDIHEPFLVKNAPLLIRGAIVILGMGVLTFLRKKLSSRFVLVSIWLLFTLFAVTLSERPYPHYLIQSIAPISILLTMLFLEKNLEQSLTVIPLALTLFVPVYYKFWYYPTGAYYLRFINFVTSKIDKDQYFASFNSKTKRNYQIADFLTKSSRKTEKVFVWGPDSATIYALSRRLPPIKYVADYHINDFSDKKTIVSLLSKNKPKFIILFPEAKPFPEIFPLLKNDYLLINKIDDAEIWSLISLRK